MFLSKDDLKELTGYINTEKQIKWLAMNGIRYLVSGDGRPRVLLSQLETLIGSDSKGNTKRQGEFDEAGLRQMMGI